MGGDRKKHWEGIKNWHEVTSGRRVHLSSCLWLWLHRYIHMFKLNKMYIINIYSLLYTVIP